MNMVKDNDISVFSYRRSLNHNYLVAVCREEDLRDYRLRMLSENKIKGLLDMSIKSSNGDYELCYEAVSVQPLERIFDKKQIGSEALRKILKGVTNVYRNISEYLINEESVVLKPEYIFADVESLDICMISYPFYSGDFKEDFLELSEFILEKVNHTDKEAVMLAYGFFKIIKSKTFTISEIEKLIKEVRPSERIRRQEVIVREELSNESESGLKTDESGKEEAVPGKRVRFYGILDKIRNRVWDNRVADKRDSEENEEFQSYSEYEDFELLDEENTEGKATFASKEKAGCDESGYGKTTLLSDYEESLINHYLRVNNSECEKIVDLSVLPVTLGKTKGIADIIFCDSSVSRMHASIFEKDNNIYIKDETSTNGTYVNDCLLTPEEEHILVPGDIIRIGKIKMTFY